MLRPVVCWFTNVFVILEGQYTVRLWIVLVCCQCSVKPLVHFRACSSGYFPRLFSLSTWPEIPSSLKQISECEFSKMSFLIRNLWSNYFVITTNCYQLSHESISNSQTCAANRTRTGNQRAEERFQEAEVRSAARYQPTDQIFGLVSSGTRWVCKQLDRDRNFKAF